MERENYKYLPIGSVVLLHDATKRIMITGFASVSPETGDKVFDYSGCYFPEGFIDYNEVFVFDNSQIKDVIYTGPIDEEVDGFMKELEEEIDNMNGEM